MEKKTQVTPPHELLWMIVGLLHLYQKYRFSIPSLNVSTMLLVSLSEAPRDVSWSFMMYSLLRRSHSGGTVRTQPVACAQAAQDAWSSVFQPHGWTVKLWQVRCGKPNLTKRELHSNVKSSSSFFFSSHACFCTVEGSRRTRREPTQSLWKHAHSIHLESNTQPPTAR